jgi:hypothetical protein
VGHGEGRDRLYQRTPVPDEQQQQRKHEQQVIDTFFQNLQTETRLTDGVIFRYAKP